MSSPIIRVEALGKKYYLNHKASERYTTLRDTLTNKFKYLLNPKKNASDTHVAAEDFWALKDVSFEIRAGEVVGIIGRNGAGKSTLLKILSRITEPTTGRISLSGRVASLLEVGTGFHPELTGRENIFLNGAILGMSRVEIKSNFDEIVDFAEIEKFLDTPVKYYSSGMYVRLAFAVAAHLEPEILIIDEILAVGDYRFQEKCLGKINQISSARGRTVLFVSHNIAAVTRLTKKCLLLNNGALVEDADTAKVISIYTKSGSAQTNLVYNNETNKITCIKSVHTSAYNSGGIHKSGSLFNIDIEFFLSEPISQPCLSIQIVNLEGVAVAHFWSYDQPFPAAGYRGTVHLHFSIPKLSLNIGGYSLTCYLSEPPGGRMFETLSNICPFTVEIRDRTTLFGWRPSACTYLENFSCQIDLKGEHNEFR
ncbi:MAG: polysaccharide ABC transporter ATP-binding protein [Nitrospira sp.]